VGALLTTSYQPAVPGIGSCRHMTEGWKALESSVCCLHRVVAGTGSSFVPYATPELRALLYQCFNHMNRFVRETAYLALAALCTALLGTPELEGMAVEIAEKLRDGLSDNWSQVRRPRAIHTYVALCLMRRWAPELCWSVCRAGRCLTLLNNADGTLHACMQVRFAASRAARELCLGISEKHRPDVFTVILPAMCLNRYYLAEGVRVYSQETWRLLMGSSGRAAVAKHIDVVVPYYISQSKVRGLMRDMHRSHASTSACHLHLTASRPGRVYDAGLP
jgi:hypothetical protein